MTYELDRLRKWKKEAKVVLADWEKVWVALGSPGTLGQSKPEACLQEIDRLNRLIEDLEIRS